MASIDSDVNRVLARPVRLCEIFMERSCRVSLVSDKTPLDPKMETMLRQLAATKKVKLLQIIVSL